MKRKLRLPTTERLKIRERLARKPLVELKRGHGRVTVLLNKMNTMLTVAKRKF